MKIHRNPSNSIASYENPWEDQLGGGGEGEDQLGGGGAGEDQQLGGEEGQGTISWVEVGHGGGRGTHPQITSLHPDYCNKL